ncbi:MAG: radical SAM domain-containing protein [Candidatus Magnetoglobus multicellularis str. Araruama]|uniref:Radical SAM domain-containing protein n=1 Tax=Candidatus Magnetoglobus multicellularis str. Araruama TaxID=890399 RepID=A0A1V1P3N9_9BACT|nr:MAG: radical SAM domain-containing protein [Candidatus Magnetoglobus multicellularis str. Araruama]
MTQNKLLLTSIFGPYGISDEYAEGAGMQMELLNNQITREQGIHSPRQSYWSFGLYLLAINISVPAAVLDFPLWDDFTKELKQGYTHIGISFIVPNVYKVKRMTEYIRTHYPGMKIILGGYGTIIPNLDEIVSYDELCKGEGVMWLRDYFGEPTDVPVKHPVLNGPAYESIYGFSSKPKGSVLLTGLGCNNGCVFCITTHQFKKKYIPLLETGKDIFQACQNAKMELGSSGFTIMDENFLKIPLRARQLLKEMQTQKRPYVFDIFSSAEVIQEVGVDFLVRLGVRMIWVGVESKINSHAKTKGIDLKKLFNKLQSNGIVVIASAILFQDHHDPETIQDEIDWVISLGSNLVQFMNYTPFPTTALYDGLKKEGRLKKCGLQISEWRR